MKLLYVSPERLSLPDFRRALGQFGLSLVAVDEAHCISEWGHEFRPDYRSLGLLRAEFPGVPIAAFTATATRQVQEDVVRQLGLRAPFQVRASFDRKEIFYRVTTKEGDGENQILRVRVRPSRPAGDRVSRHAQGGGEHSGVPCSPGGSPRWPTTRAWNDRTGARGRRRL